MVQNNVGSEGYSYYVTSSGVDKTNLRQYVEKSAKKGNKCKCIRCREAGISRSGKSRTWK